jgi:alpha-galactosidase
MNLRLACVALIVCLSGCATVAFADPVVQVKTGDASITHDADAGLWTISAGGTTLTLVLGPQVDLMVQRLVTSSGKSWSLNSAPDTSVTINGTLAPLGAGTSGFFFESASSSQSGSTVRLDATFDLDSNVRITRHYLAASGSPAFEVWTTFQSVSGVPVAVSNINALQLVVPFGTVHWITGLQGDNATVDHEQAFTLQSRSLAPGGQLSLGSDRRSSEQMVPWVTIDGSPDEFFAGLMWSGAWSLSATRSETGISLTIGLPTMTTKVSNQTVDGPHALFGVVRGGAAQATAALRAYIVTGLRKGKQFSPLVTYNTWFAYGTQMDETSLKAEMSRVAALGTELFVVDAGWYVGTGVAGPFDFEAGLGTWQVDTARFPNGLNALTDYAHSLGMKFGLWVEPERVSLATVGVPSLAQETWLATSSGAYGSATAALICLGGSAGRQWMQSQLTRLIDAVQPDYLKWDNNQWVNCNRDGHDHGQADGNFAQVNGLYQVLASLRARYPNLLIENVSNGGNRLDLGMMRYTDVAWMDDRTAPSSHVRHNIQGLSTIFPPAYLLSFVTDAEAEPLHNAVDLPLYFRSRAR